MSGKLIWADILGRLHKPVLILRLSEHSGPAADCSGLKGRDTNTDTAVSNRVMVDCEEVASVFNQLVVSGKSAGGPSKSYAFVVGIFQCAIVGILMLIPLVYTEALPHGMLNTLLVAPAPPSPSPPPAAIQKRRTIITTARMLAPTHIPKNTEVFNDKAPDVSGVVVGTTDLGETLSGIAPGAVPAPPRIVAPTRIRVGGNVAAARIIIQTPPVYPAIARTAHVSGAITLHAVIAKDGTIQELEYVLGVPHC